MVAGAFAPWARVAAGALGSGPPALLVSGTRIGLDLGMAPWGWVVLAAGAVGAVGLLGDATLAIAAGFAGAVAAAANALLVGLDVRLLLPAPIDDLTHPHTSLAWGSLLALAASLVLFVAAATVRNRRLA
jgi:hypothetical protein